MCGLIGVIDPKGAEAHRAALVRGQQALSHRGPDGEGLWIEGAAGLAHRLLAISDPRAVGAGISGPADQPAVSDDGRYVLVFNGEVYNADTLGEGPGPGDTRRLLHHLARKGPAGLRDLRGMFALALWDRVLGEGFVARDPAGVKPLVWAQRGEAVWFASETGALREALGERGPPSEQAFVRWLGLPAFTGDQPPFVGIESLDPGTYRWVGDRYGTKRWWRPDDEPLDDDALVTKLRMALPEAIAATSRAPWRRGLLLSGGLDSSLVLHHGRPDVALSLRWEGQEGFDWERSSVCREDDGPWAQRAATWAGVPLVPVAVPQARLGELIAAVARQDPHLPAWEQQLSQQALFEGAHQQGLKVVLVGDAADETWGGYGFLRRPEVASIPGLMRFFRTSERLRFVHRRIRAQGDPEKIVAADLSAAAVAGRVDPSGPGEIVAQALVADRWLRRLLHNGDIHSMAHGIEARVPFADPELLRLAARARPHQTLRRGVEKWVLREASGLRRDLAWRPKSALPPNLGAGPELHRLLSRALDRGGPIGEWFDADALRHSLSAGPDPDEALRGVWFAALAFDAWAPRWAPG